MTLPSRRKRQITALNTQLANQIKCCLPASLVGLASFGLVCCVETTHVTAQDWQPTRLPADTSAKPLSSGAVRMGASFDETSRPVLSSEQQLGSGMVLRWRSTAPRGAEPLNSRDNATGSVSQSNYRVTTSSTHVEFVAGSTGRNASDFASSPNCLRTSSSDRSFNDNPVRQAAYQDPGSPQWRSVKARRQDETTQLDQLPQQRIPGNDNLNQLLQDLDNLQQPANPGFQDKPQLDPPRLGRPSGDTQQKDALDQPEAAPLPPPRQTDPPSFPRTLNEDRSPADKKSSDDNRLRDGESDSSKQDTDDLDKLLKQARKSKLPSCDARRDQLRGQPLSNLNLDVAPKLSNGVREEVDAKEVEKLRKEFEQRAIRRDWTDYKGSILASGRMKSLRHGNVVIDVDGREQLIPLNKLSDVDMSYIAELWNLPFRCGSGDDPWVGRDFVASTVQWKASGACHSPLYFEQVQLERYGHEAGPIVQPLLSSAHFFLTIPILPYKMAINPMNECQYALGHLRPGNCAPYMIQPFPLSLRGGLAQTGAVLGMAAVLP